VNGGAAKWLVADHPGPGGRKTLGAAFCLCHRPCRLLSRTAAAAGPMRGLVLIERFRRMRAALVDCDRLALVRRHAEEIRRSQDDTRRRCFALRAILRIVAFRHRPHVLERTAIVTEIFVDWHCVSPCQSCSRMRAGCGAAEVAVPHPVARGEAYLSGEIGIWISPLICLIGPADDGITSKSKISVGSHSVAQAFGTSTTPEIWPWHGAVPRIE